MLGFLPRALQNACSDVIKAVQNEGGDSDEEEDEDEKVGQDHVFTFYEKLNEENQRQLDEDFDSFNLDEIDEAWITGKDVGNFAIHGIVTEGPRVMNWELKKPPACAPGANLTNLEDVNERKRSGWYNLGLEMYSKDRIAIVVLSGGMDSRIGGDCPKGALDVGLLSHKSIFQLYMERIRRLQHLTQRKFKRSVHIPIYIMCNRANKQVVEDFFRQNEFFGVREQDVLFFVQAQFPIVDKKGKFLLAEKHRIAMAPCGNGGLYRALVEEGMISDMKSRGVTSIFVCSVDNVLTKVGDPTFMGFCETVKADAGVKTVTKVLPNEKFGVFCSQVYRDTLEDVDGDGKLDVVAKVKAAVVEFFDIPDDLKARRRQAGSGGMPLDLNAGNLSQYFLKVDFVKKTHHIGIRKYHLIPTNCPFINLKNGHKETPDKHEKNAFRIEMFIFDAFENCKHVAGLMVPKSEYAVIKNPVGNQSPATALQAVGRLHQQWIIAAGGQFNQSKIANEQEDHKCEISPLVSYDGEDLLGHFPKQVSLPFYLPSQQELGMFSAATTNEMRRPSTNYLDHESDVARHELEAELQGQLAHVLEMMEDKTKYDYAGERAEEDEALPPTPRLDQKDKRGKGAETPEGSEAGSEEAKAEEYDKDKGAGSKDPLDGPPTTTMPTKDSDKAAREEYWAATEEKK